MLAQNYSLPTMILTTESATAGQNAPTLANDDCQSEASSSQDSSIAFASLVWHPMPYWKRLFDICVAGLLLVLLMPAFILIGLFIRLVSRGPVLFKQKRLGEMGNYFVIYKFRTLHPSDSVCPTTEHREFMTNLTTSQEIAAKPDLSSRLIPGGRFLRSHSIDELPQLLNVLRGEMSLIGPRPDVLDWQDYPPWQLRRFEVTPGITGLWQVSGKNRLTFSQMVELDIKYIENRSWLLDMWILAKTFKLVLSKDNN
jgi:lipopolysaccharide/colanic/teichoic acid biosynthesis glycosyltransferase